MNTSILVVSCDAYSDLWDPFFKLFYGFWPDCPYPIYLQTNHKEYSHEKAKTIKIGDDIDWSSNLQLALDQIPTKYVLILLEDFFLCKVVKTKIIEKLAALISQRNAAYLRLVPKPPPDEYLNDDLNIGIISIGQMYRVSFQAGIWDKEILKKILKPGENAWAAEMEGSRRSDKVAHEFLSVNKAPYSEWPIHYMNAVIKRKWTPETVDFCRDNDISLDLNKRLVCNFYDQLRRKGFFRKMVSIIISITRFLLGDRIYSYLKNNSLLRKLIY